MQARLSAPFGHVRVEVEQGEVIAVHLDPRDAEESIPDGFPDHVLVAVRAYLDGRAPRPIAPRKADGTTFQRSVWRAISDIPPGQTRTYGELADQVGKPGGAQAVGQALRKNPLPLIWPCHRVTAKDDIGGFGGATGSEDEQVQIKRWLLDHERSMVSRRFEDDE